MNYTEDGFAAMLLTVALSPNREEYAKPLSVAEFRALEAAARNSRFGRVGKLMDVDISGLMIYLHIDEQQAIRVFTLLSRTVQMMYLLEGFERRGIEGVTCFDDGYPKRALRKLGAAAPVFCFCSAGAALQPPRAVAILGVRGVRTSEAVRNAVEALVRAVTARGYAVITGGEPGVSRVAAAKVAECGGQLLEVVSGGLADRVREIDMIPRIATGMAAVLSLEHPEAMPTASHAAIRNRFMLSLANAAFIFSTDGGRGDAGLFQDRVCDWVYAWEDRPENRPLIARGAIPFGDVSHWDFDALSRHWSSSDSEQMSIFDLLP